MTQDIGKRIKLLRRSQRMSQRQLAEKAGISRNMISRIEVGRSEPSWTTIKKILSALDCVVVIVRYEVASTWAKETYKDQVGEWKP